MLFVFFLPRIRGGAPLGIHVFYTGLITKRQEPKYNVITYDCVFQKIASSDSGGAVFISSIDISAFFNTTLFIDCSASNQISNKNSGAFALFPGKSASITNCCFVNCWASSSYQVFQIYLLEDSYLDEITNSLIYNCGRRPSLAGVGPLYFLSHWPGKVSLMNQTDNVIDHGTLIKYAGSNFSFVQCTFENNKMTVKNDYRNNIFQINAFSDDLLFSEINIYGNIVSGGSLVYFEKYQDIFVLFEKCRISNNDYLYFSNGRAFVTLDKCYFGNDQKLESSNNVENPYTIHNVIEYDPEYTIMEDYCPQYPQETFFSSKNDENTNIIGTNAMTEANYPSSCITYCQPTDERNYSTSTNFDLKTVSNEIKETKDFSAMNSQYTHDTFFYSGETFIGNSMMKTKPNIIVSEFLIYPGIYEYTLNELPGNFIISASIAIFIVVAVVIALVTYCISKPEESSTNDEEEDLIIRIPIISPELISFESDESGE